jgi:plasmid maintenance system antidote protein VapI
MNLTGRAELETNISGRLIMVEYNSDMKLQQYANELADDPEFIAEGLSIKVIEDMLHCMQNRGLSQSWLADKMGVTRAHISKILNAPPNMTLLTIAKIAVALGVQPDVCLKPKIDFSWFPSSHDSSNEVKIEDTHSGINIAVGKADVGITAVTTSGIIQIPAIGTAELVLAA